MKGKLIVISAPSGTGKTTVIKNLLASHPNFVLSVSYTTRELRPSEKDGVDYHFVADKKFKEMINKGEMVEWAMVHGNYYGTPATPLKKWMGEGLIVVLDVDTVGAKNIKKMFPEAVLIFLLPPTGGELEKRLLKRGENKNEDLKVRIKNAKKEMKEKDRYDYQVVNNNLADAIKEIEKIINA